LRSQIEALKAELAAQESNQRQALDELRASETAISEASRALSGLEAQAKDARQAAGELQARQRALDAGIAARKEALGRLLASRAVERAGSGVPDLVRIALSGEHPNEVVRRTVYQTALSRAATAAIEAHRDALAELERVRAGIGERSRELAALEAHARAERARLLAERRERRQILARIGGELRSTNAQMQAMVQQQEKLGRIVGAIGRFHAEPATSTAENVTFSTLRGKLVLPVREAHARIPARTSRSSALKGVFLAAREGEPVRAVAAGRVVYADWMRGFGNLLIVDHGDAYLSIYGNNEALLKQPGDAVAAGEAVATVGSSGGRQESGLYFELRHLGKSFDPLLWLPRQ